MGKVFFQSSRPWMTPSGQCDIYIEDVPCSVQRHLMLETKWLVGIVIYEG